MFSLIGDSPLDIPVAREGEVSRDAAQQTHLSVQRLTTVQGENLNLEAEARRDREKYPPRYTAQ